VLLASQDDFQNCEKVYTALLIALSLRPRFVNIKHLLVSFLKLIKRTTSHHKLQKTVWEKIIIPRFGKEKKKTQLKMDKAFFNLQPQNINQLPGPNN